MTTTEIALLSTCIGASAGIFSQIIANVLRNKTDKQKIIFDCISEERKLAHLLYIRANRLEKIQITTEYYYQLSVIESEKEERERHTLNYGDEIRLGGNAFSEYTSTLGDYCKNIYLLMLHTQNSKEMEAILSQIISHKFDDYLNAFEKIDIYPELFESYSKLIKLVDTKLEFYKQLLNDMQKQIQIEVKNIDEYD